jgi:hypothetical protein
MDDGRPRAVALRLRITVEELDILVGKADADLHTVIIPRV